jgi:cell wall-associated NlpC family hydrolase
MRAALLLLALLATGCGAAHSSRAPVLLPQAYGAADRPATERDWRVVLFAAQQVGKRYCWGGGGPQCFDCSGLVKVAWGTVGVRLPHSADAIGADLEEIPASEVRAGDILWWPGHVAIYAGNGWSIEALDHRHGVVRRPAREPARAFRPPG